MKKDEPLKSLSFELPFICPASKAFIDFVEKRMKEENIEIKVWKLDNLCVDQSVMIYEKGKLPHPHKVLIMYIDYHQLEQKKQTFSVYFLKENMKGLHQYKQADIDKIKSNLEKKKIHTTIEQEINTSKKKPKML